MIEIKLSDKPLNQMYCIQKAGDASCGGMVVFVGTVRNMTQGKKVVRLEFECYESMALKELQKIADTATTKWDIKNIIIHHRTGILNIMDIAVIIVVNAAHRKEAFGACSFAIDALKSSVPIWKKEIFDNGNQWVNAYP